MHTRRFAVSPAVKTRTASKPLTAGRARVQRVSRLSSLHKYRRRELEGVERRVANFEGTVSVNDSPEETTDPTDPPVDPDDSNQDLENPSDEPSQQTWLESMISRSWMCIAVMAVTFSVLLGSYSFIESITESQLSVACLIPLIWSWGCRFADLRKEHKVRRVLSMLVRIVLFVALLTAAPYQTRTFIFQYQRGIFPICAFFTFISVIGHFFLRPRIQPEPIGLRKPDFEFISPFFADDVEAFTKTELRMSLWWMYLSSIVVLPFLQEVLYRGVFVISLAHLYDPLLSAILGAVAYNLTQPFESFRQQLASLFVGFIWGCIFLISGGNLMFPLVAHLMHNSILFAGYHFDNLVESL